MFTINSNNLAVATVTYNKRYHLLHKVIISALSARINNIVIVNNGCPYNVEEKIRADFPDEDKIQVITLSKNNGSAEGFSCAIENAASINSVNYILLLDDDNVIDNESVEGLFNAYNFINDDDCCLLCLRDDRKEFVDASKSGVWNNAQKNSFQSFNLVNLFQFRRRTDSCYPFVPIEYAPYGGFLFNKKWPEKIGLPNIKYGLYGDDHEYTYRINRAGGKLYLSTKSKVTDLEKSWYIDKSKAHRFFIPNVDKNRLYMSIKNRVRFELDYLVDNQAIYLSNMFIYVIVNFILSSFYNRKSYLNFPTIFKAIRDSINEK